MALYTWGHNNAQQLGLDADDKIVFDIRRVAALAREAVADVSAGEQHTLAVTEFGDVFAWGRGKEGQLGLGRDAPFARTPTRVTLGGLAGHRIVQVSCGDAHSVALSAAGRVFMWGLLPAAVGGADDAGDHATVSLAGLSSSLYEDAPALSPRSLRASMTDTLMARLVRDSMLVYETETLAGSNGYGAYSESESESDRKVHTIRRPVFVPRACASLAGVHITAVAAGFAHSLAVSDAGAVFSCGYNDNGQLGTGSRRNAAEFTHVRALDKRRIRRVACGQQHSLACCGRDEQDQEADGACFAWGLGVLGQLGTGHGVPVAYLPVRVPVPEPVADVAAGSHHSVAVTRGGDVYTWGHSEYGQHGAHAEGASSGDDLQRRANYFLPRKQAALADDELDGVDEVRRVVDAVACSSHSTFVIARDVRNFKSREDGADSGGQVFSWGWNAFGVLGNGKIQRTVRPQRLFALGDRAAVRVAAGANHGAVVVRPRGCYYAMRMDAVLARADFADVEVEARSLPPSTGKLRAHRVVLAARSPYLRGLLRAAASATGDGDRDGPVVVDAFRDEDAAVVRALLVFLYTNRVAVAVHKKRALAALAARVHCEDLVVACEDPWRRQLRTRGGTDGDPADADEDEDASRPSHPFVRDMRAALASANLADVDFLWPAGDGTTVRIPAHKAVLSQVEYFRTMFLGGFSEAAAAGGAAAKGTTTGRHEIPLLFMPRDGVTLAAFRRLLLWIYTGCFELLLAPAAADGPNSGWDGIYGRDDPSPAGGSGPDECGPDEVMDLFVGASLLNLRVLEAQCERQLLAWLPRLGADDTDSLRACRDFGARFGARKLQTISERLLRTVADGGDEDGDADGDEDADEDPVGTTPPY